MIFLGFLNIGLGILNLICAFWDFYIDERERALTSLLACVITISIGIFVLN